MSAPGQTPAPAEDEGWLRATEEFSLSVLSSMYWFNYTPRQFASRMIDGSDAAIHLVNCVLRRRPLAASDKNVRSLLRLAKGLGIDDRNVKIYEGVGKR